MQREGYLCMSKITAYFRSRPSGKHGCTITTIISGIRGLFRRTHGEKCADLLDKQGQKASENLIPASFVLDSFLFL